MIRAAKLGLPMALAIIGGHPGRFQPVVELYRETAAGAGHDGLPLSINAHGFLAEDAQDAADTAYPAFAETMNRIGRERGWPPMTRGHFDAECLLNGALFVGSPQEVTEKILYQHELFGHDRFLVQLTVGRLPHEKVLRAIELLGAEVAPAVRKALGDRTG